VIDFQIVSENKAVRMQYIICTFYVDIDIQAVEAANASARKGIHFAIHVRDNNNTFL